MASTASSSPTLASTLLSLRFALTAAVCLLLLIACSCSAPLKTGSNRKVLVAVEDLPLAGNAGGGDRGETAASESELRRVPSGPDPLHHHGSTPKKPDNRNKLTQNP